LTDERALLIRTAELAAQYLDTLDTRPIRPDADYAAMLLAFEGPVPEEGMDPIALVDELAAAAEPGLTAMGSGRYFGFVIGGALPASLAADWLVSAWDQNAGLAQPTPAVAALETVTGRWVLDLLGLPSHSSFAFVTGCQMAHVTSLAAARQAVYEKIGYDLREHGLAGAPALHIVVGEKRHVTLTRALRLLGIGRAQELVVPVDDQGRMRAELLEGVLADVDGPTIVCAQAGEVNTGAFADVETLVAVAHAQGAWVHVDGAFGLWAAASPKLAHLVQGHAAADSWATDAHKWLNVPYDCGIAICAHPAMHAAAMEYAAPYLAVGGEAERDPMGYSPEFSRRARSLPAWAAIRSLGRKGLAEMIEGSCANAVAIAEGLAALPGCEIVNDVVLNQVLLRFDDERTAQVVAAVQQEGEAWMSPTVWNGRPAIRISVSNWRTDADDVRRTVAAFARAVAADGANDPSPRLRPPPPVPRAR
jgi:glutamate/tyrosine decarboxylase-like PLP-dependent enzyme